jgi:hypothetical protein
MSQEFASFFKKSRRLAISEVDILLSLYNLQSSDGYNRQVPNNLGSKDDLFEDGILSINRLHFSMRSDIDS